MQSNKPPTLSYFVPGPSAKVSLVFAYSGVLEPRSVVAKVKWLPQDIDNKSELNLSWSDALKSHFTYLPRATTPGLKDGPTLRVDGPGTIEISFLTWPSRKEITDNRISGTYLRTYSSLRGQSFSGLQRILEVGAAE